MANEYITWAYQQVVTPSAAKFVLVTLADTANGDGYSYPGQKTLAARTGQSERSVREHLAMLEAEGYIRRSQRRRQDGSRTSDAYNLPPRDATGEICRWEPTGEICRAPRQISPDSPAKSAGHEPSVEPSSEPPERKRGADRLFADSTEQPLTRLRKMDRDAFKELETLGGQLRWKFRHKNLAARHVLENRDDALEALRIAHKGARDGGASAYRYFERIIESPKPTKPGDRVYEDVDGGDLLGIAPLNGKWGPS